VSPAGLKLNSLVTELAVLLWVTLKRSPQSDRGVIGPGASTQGGGAEVGGAFAVGVGAWRWRPGRPSTRQLAMRAGAAVVEGAGQGVGVRVGGADEPRREWPPLDVGVEPQELRLSSRSMARRPFPP